MKTLDRKRELAARLANAERATNEQQTPPRVCRGCGAKEQINCVGYTNFMPSMLVCVTCAANVIRSAK